MDADDALHALGELAAPQWGLFTTAQAGQWDVDRATLSRLTRRSLLRSLGHGVHALSSAEGGPLEDLRAAWLSTDRAHTAEERLMTAPQVVVSHASAAALHGIGDLVPQAHQFTVTVRKQSRRHGVRFHRAELTEDDIALVNGLPVTTVERTVADLARAGVEFGHLAAVVSDGLALPSARYSRMAEHLDPVARRYDIASGELMVDACLEEMGMPDGARELTERALALAHRASTTTSTATSHRDVR